MSCVFQTLVTSCQIIVPQYSYNSVATLPYTGLLAESLYNRSYMYLAVFCYCVYIYICSCPPRAFIPALCKIFMDPQAPDNILEVTARAMTYFLDVSVDCSRRIAAVKGAFGAIVLRLHNIDLSSRASKDLAEQCVKVLNEWGYV